MPVELTRSDFNRLISLLRELPDFKLADKRVDFVEDVFYASPRKQDILGHLNLTGAPHEVALRLVQRLLYFGQDVPGHEVLDLLIEKLLDSYIGAGDNADFLRGLRTRYALTDSMAAAAPLDPLLNTDSPKERREVPPTAAEPGPRIFLSYARPDEDQVARLYERLAEAGYRPWMDVRDILGGEVWSASIRRAIRNADFFVACLSSRAVGRRGTLQREIREALDIWQEKLEDDIYCIPVRLDECQPPDSLRQFQWIDLFREDGWPRLLQALQEGMRRFRESLREAPPLSISLTIVAPDGAQFVAEIPQETLIEDVLHAFLAQWQPSSVEPVRSVHYDLKLSDSADSSPLEPWRSLAGAGLTDRATLLLLPRFLEPDTPVSLMVEDRQGQRYATAVRLKTPVAQLANAFLAQTGQSACKGDILAEVVSQVASGKNRRLNPRATLFEQGVRDEELLRIVCLADAPTP